MPPPTGVGPPPAASAHSVKLKLKYLNNNAEKPSKLKVFEIIFKTLNAQLTKLIPIDTGYIAFMDSSIARDTLCSHRGLTELSKINLAPTQSREQMAERSLFIKRLDSVAGSHSAEEIKHELHQNHTWLQITEVHKIKNFTHIIKIVCSTSEMANQAIEQGLLLFYTRISPTQITKEKFTPLQTCFKCYKVNDHNTSDCPQTQTKCSICSQPGHAFSECKSNNRICLNCPPPNNQHGTMYHGCPYRKDQQKKAEEQKQQRLDSQTNDTYRNIVKTTIKETQKTAPQPTQNLILTQDIQVKLAACIIEAHITAFLYGKNYNEIVHYNLKKNFNLENMQFTPRDTTQIANITNLINTNLPKQTESQTSASELPPKPQRDPRIRDTSRSRQAQQHMDTDQDTDTNKWQHVGKHRSHSRETNPKREQSPLQIKPTDIHIYRSDCNSTEIPAEPDSDWLVTQVKRKALKIRIYHDRWEEVTNKLLEGTIDFKINPDNINLVRDEDYQKMQGVVGLPLSTKRKHYK